MIFPCLLLLLVSSNKQAVNAVNNIYTRTQLTKHIPSRINEEEYFLSTILIGPRSSYQLSKQSLVP